MGCLSGKHPAEEEGAGEGEGPQVQETEGSESVCVRGSSLQALWTLQRLFDRGGLRGVCQLPRQAQVRGTQHQATVLHVS